MSLKCTTVRVAKLNTFVESPPIIPSSIHRYIDLDIVGKVEKNIQLVYDEGDTRIIRREATLTLTAVIGEETYKGIMYNNGTPVTADQPFEQKLVELTNFLSQQQLAIDLNKYPQPFLNAISGGYYDYPSGGPYDYAGWLVDNFNGPRPLEIQFDDIAGSENVVLTWKVKYTFSHIDQDVASVKGNSQRGNDLDALVVKPKLSGELRMDIDEDGDIIIIYSGTVYADSPALLYKAREWLLVYMVPSGAAKIGASTREEIEEQKDLFAQYNGFKKKVIFNVDKSGRNAKFTITYSQVKSNNAYPLGIRDIEFDQELESALTGKGMFSPKAFSTWRHVLSGSIRIPHRFDAQYAWYIFHLLVLQKLRHSEMSIKVSESSNEEDPTNREIDGVYRRTFGGAGAVISIKRTRTRAIPLKIKLKHRHYRRKMEFHFEFFHVCPMNKIMHSVCFFDRLNNDYQRKLNRDALPPDERQNQDFYSPISLSEQWLAWQKSVDPQNRFDPTQENGINLFGTILPHRDNAGHEIFDTGHGQNLKNSINAQQAQKIQLVTTVTDPNEIDPAYTDYYADEPSNATAPAELPMPTSPPTGTNYPLDTTELPPNPQFDNPIVTVNGNRKMMEVTPETSWLRYEQQYTFIEKHTTVPMEAFAGLTSDHFTSRNLNQDDPDAPDYVSGDEEARYAKWVDENTGRAKFASTNINPYTEEEHYGFIDRPEADYEEKEFDPQNPGTEKERFFRRTYASAPSRFYLRVQGTAMRARYKIPIPSVITIAGERAIRVGEHRTKLFTIGAGGDMPINVAVWDQLYTIDKSMLSDDLLASIQTSGAEVIYA